jgi:uncharacterized cupredoxin-like copper-binding protein
MQILKKSFLLRAPGAIVITTMVLFLSACSFGDHGEGHGHGDDQHGEGEDDHSSKAGVPGSAENVTKTVAVDMNDSMAFTPSEITVKAGETIHFTVTNSGKLVHEFILGDGAEILEHHELMKRFPGMEHDEPNSVSLEADGSGDVIWQFSNAGTFQFACLQPGHFEAGMKGNVVVSAQ